MFVYKTNLSDALLKSFSPWSVVLKCHLQKALFKFNLGYYFNAMSAFPLTFKFVSIWSTIEPNPNYLIKVLKAIYFSDLIFIDIIMKELIKMFLIIFSLGFSDNFFLLNKENPSWKHFVSFLFNNLYKFITPIVYFILSSSYCSVIDFKKSYWGFLYCYYFC